MALDLAAGLSPYDDLFAGSRGSGLLAGACYAGGAGQERQNEDPMAARWRIFPIPFKA
jgi:hypothetical protein